jgi:hypothetical protein
MITQVGPEIPNIAQNSGVKIVAGPYVNREHLTVAVVESDTADAVDRFLIDSRLAQWNSVRVLPSQPLQEGMADLEAQTPLF